MPIVEGGGTARPTNPGTGFGTGLSGKPAGTPTSVQKAGPTRTPKKQPKSGDANRQRSTPVAPARQPAKGPQPQRVAPGLAGVNAMIAQRIQAMVAAAPGKITFNSGFRTGEQQQKLYNDYKAGKGNLAAKPGSSNHEHGLACDLGYADDATRKWVQQNAARFGLHFPVKGEPWHAEPVESRGGTLSGDAVKFGFKPIAFKEIKSSGRGIAEGRAAKGLGTVAGVAPPLTPGSATAGAAPVGAAPMGAGGVMGAAPGADAAAPGGGAVDMGGAPDVFGPDGKIDPVKALQTYGFVYELAKSVPELQKVLSDAIMGGWSADRFAATVQTTKWWKTTNDNQRRVLELQKTNPGEYARQRQQKIDEIVIQQRNLGVTMDSKKIQALADKALSLGWSPQEVSRYVAADVKVQVKGNTGATAVTVDSLKEQAAQYGVPMSTATLQTWTTQILRGMVPADAFQSYLKEQAKSLFPGMSAAIDAGISVKQYVEPYRQLTAQTLELNPNGLELDNPHLRKALYAQGKDGMRTQMTLSEYTEYLRGTPDYRKTRQAQESAASLTNTITEIFGATA